MDDLGVRDIYDALVANGNHPNMAAMLASQSPPGTWNTDSDFSRRENDRMCSMDEQQRETIVKVAKMAGVNTTGKTYNGQLGRYTDQDAWVSDTHDVKNVALKKGMDIDGLVKVKGYRGPKKKKRIGDDILDRLEAQARSKDAALNQRCVSSKKARHELRERLTEKHSKKKD